MPARCNLRVHPAAGSCTIEAVAWQRAASRCVLVLFVFSSPAVLIQALLVGGGFVTGSGDTAEHAGWPDWVH